MGGLLRLLAVAVALGGFVVGVVALVAAGRDPSIFMWAWFTAAAGLYVFGVLRRGDAARGAAREERDRRDAEERDPRLDALIREIEERKHVPRGGSPYRTLPERRPVRADEVTPARGTPATKRTPWRLASEDRPAARTLVILAVIIGLPALLVRGWCNSIDEDYRRQQAEDAVRMAERVKRAHEADRAPSKDRP